MHCRMDKWPTSSLMLIQEYGKQEQIAPERFVTKKLAIYELSAH